MLWIIPVHARDAHASGELDHGVAVEAESWAEAALTIADDPDWEVTFIPPVADLGFGE